MNQIYVARCPHCGSGYDFYKAFKVDSAFDINDHIALRERVENISKSWNNETECLNCKKMYRPSDKGLTKMDQFVFDAVKNCKGE